MYAKHASFTPFLFSHTTAPVARQAVDRWNFPSGCPSSKSSRRMPPGCRASSQALFVFLTDRRTHKHTLRMTLNMTDAIPSVSKLVSFLRSHLFNHLLAICLPNILRGKDDAATAFGCNLGAQAGTGVGIPTAITDHCKCLRWRKTCNVPCTECFFSTCTVPWSQGGTHAAAPVKG